MAEACAEIEGLPNALAALAAVLDRREASVLERVAAVELAQQRPPAKTVGVQTDASAPAGDDVTVEALLGRLKAMEERLEGMAASGSAGAHDHAHAHTTTRRSVLCGTAVVVELPLEDGPLGAAAYR